MPKEQNKIMMRKVCTVIQSLVSYLPNHHSSHSYDCKKHHTFLTLIRRVNTVHDVTDVYSPIPERANLLAVVEGVQSCFLYITAIAWTIKHVYQARSEGPVVERQCVLDKQSAEPELRVVEEARACGPILLRVNLPQ